MIEERVLDWTAVLQGEHILPCTSTEIMFVPQNKPALLDAYHNNHKNPFGLTHAGNNVSQITEVRLDV